MPKLGSLLLCDKRYISSEHYWLGILIRINRKNKKNEGTVFWIHQPAHDLKHFGLMAEYSEYHLDQWARCELEF